VLSRLLVFYFYGGVVLGNLYFGFGDFAINYGIVLRYLRTTLAVFLGIILFMFLFIFYEIYLRCSDLNYRIRLVKDDNEYKLKLCEKEKGQSDYHSKRKFHRWSGGNQSHHNSREQVQVPPSIHKSSFDM
jgi:ABC-type transport system involved in cytochrome bd biosynthesis fused ATPase/permease subunit